MYLKLPGPGNVAQWESTCLACSRPWYELVQIFGVFCFLFNVNSLPFLPPSLLPSLHLCLPVVSVSLSFFLSLCLSWSVTICLSVSLNRVSLCYPGCPSPPGFKESPYFSLPSNWDFRLHACKSAFSFSHPRGPMMVPHCGFNFHLPETQRTLSVFSRASSLYTTFLGGRWSWGSNPGHAKQGFYHWPISLTHYILFFKYLFILMFCPFSLSHSFYCL